MNLLPRLKQFGKSLNKIEDFVDKTWTFIDENDLVNTYRFSRNKTVVVAKSGVTNIWSWEYFHPDGLHIYHGSSGLMYRHAFVLDGILLLQKEDTNSDFFILYNESVVQNGDVVSYLKKIIASKLRLQKIPGAPNYYYSNNDGLGLRVGKEVFDENLEPVYHCHIRNQSQHIIIENGKINILEYQHKTDTNIGRLNVKSKEENYSVGDIITTDDGNAFDGSFKTLSGSEQVTVVVNHGVIQKIKRPYPWVVAVAILIAFIILSILFTNSINRDISATKSNDELKTSNDLVTDSNVSATTEISAPGEVRKLFDKENAVNRISSYFETINKREFAGLEEYVAPVVNDFFKIKNLSREEVVKRTVEFWNSQSNESQIFYEPNKITAEELPDGFLVKANILERSGKGIYKIPVFYNSTLTYTLNEQLKITSFESIIISSEFDIYTMFDIAGDATTEDVRLRNSTDDFSKIFSKIREVAAVTPTAAQDYKKAVVTLYGVNTVVNYFDNGDKFETIDQFIDKIIEQEIKVRYVNKVSNESSYKLVSISVN